MTRAGPSGPALRRGSKDRPTAMLRFALAPDGAVVPDIRRKLPGRGVWTSLSAEAVRRAAAKGAFARAFRAKANATEELAGDVDALLERDALQSLSMANKAGLVVAGAFKVDSAIARWRGRRPDPGRRRSRRRPRQTRTGAQEPGRRRGGGRPARSLLVASIGFGVGEGKCDTCCSQIRRSDIGLPGAGRAAAPFSCDRSGRECEDRRRRRFGLEPPRRTREQTMWLKSQPIRNGHERNEQYR